MDTRKEAEPQRRRQHSAVLKSQVLAECRAPGASVAKVAMAHGLNANLVHKWRWQADHAQAPSVPSFIPVEVAAAVAVSEPPGFLEVEFQRGGVSVRVRWPMAEASANAAWLREILR